MGAQRGYTYRDRMMQAVANAHTADQKKPEPASAAAVLNGAPTDGEVQSAVFRPANPHSAQQPPEQRAQARRQTELRLERFRPVWNRDWGFRHGVDM